MKLKTDNKTHVVMVEPFETIVVEFQPDGINALENSRKVGFAIETMFTPNGQIALSLKFPKEKTYRINDESLTIVLCDFPGFEKLSFMPGEDIDSIIELEKI